jgi:Protein of unknown function (DUF4231)
VRASPTTRIVPDSQDHGRPVAQPDATITRLDEQIDWYDRKSRASQRRFKTLKTLQMMLAAAIPVLAATHVPVYASAIFGGAIVVLEGILQLNQDQQTWVNYRSTCEALRHEKYLYLAKAGVYAGTHPLPVLAVRIESLISQENAKWVSTALDTRTPNAETEHTGPIRHVASLAEDRPGDKPPRRPATIG